MPLQPGAADLLATPVAPTVVQAAFGTSAAISYQIVAVNAAGQDSVPSAATTTPANNAATPSNALTWVAIPGAVAYRVIKNSTLLTTVAAGATTYTDATNGNGTAYTVIATNPSAFLPSAVSMLDGGKWTYRVAKTGLVIAAAATDFAVLTGSASKTIRVTHVEVSGTATTLLTQDVQLFIRTTADTAGTSTAPTAFPLDQNAPAVSATCAVYTANPTVNDGTNRLIASQKVLFNLPSALIVGSESTRFVLDFGNRPSQAIVLRGVAQQLALNLNAGTLTAPLINIMYEFTEE